MPETRYMKVYRDGKLIDEEPYEVSDAELELEGAEQVIREISAKPDDKITTREVAKFLKALARLR